MSLSPYGVLRFHGRGLSTVSTPEDKGGATRLSSPAGDQLQQEVTGSRCCPARLRPHPYRPTPIPGAGRPSSGPESLLWLAVVSPQCPAGLTSIWANGSEPFSGPSLDPLLGIIPEWTGLASSFCQCRALLYSFSALLRSIVPYRDAVVPLWPKHTRWGDQSSSGIWSFYCPKWWLTATSSLFTVDIILKLLTEPSSANQSPLSRAFVAVFGSWPASSKLELPSLPSPSGPPPLAERLSEWNALD